jgi:hypothetical protein
MVIDIILIGDEYRKNGVNDSILPSLLNMKLIM